MLEAPLPLPISSLSQLPYYRYQSTCERRKLIDAWLIFEEVYMKNLVVAAEIAAGKKVGYFVFTSAAARHEYKIGKQLHCELYPQYNWSIHY